MNRREFIRKVRKAGRSAGVVVRFVPAKGKGSHGTLYYGDRFTIVAYNTGDFPPGTLRGMLRALGLTVNDL